MGELVSVIENQAVLCGGYNEGEIIHQSVFYEPMNRSNNTWQRKAVPHQALDNPGACLHQYDPGDGRNGSGDGADLK